MSLEIQVSLVIIIYIFFYVEIKVEVGFEKKMIYIFTYETKRSTIMSNLFWNAQTHWAEQRMKLLWRKKKCSRLAMSLCVCVYERMMRIHYFNSCIWKFSITELRLIIIPTRAACSPDERKHIYEENSEELYQLLLRQKKDMQFYDGKRENAVQ